MPGEDRAQRVRARRRPRSSQPGRDRGAAAVEMALVLPMLLLIIFGTIDFGRMLNAQLTLTEAAREGARSVAVGQTATQANARIANVASGLSGGVTSIAGTTGCTSGDATVTLTYDFQFVTPVSAIAGMFGSGLGSAVTLKGKGVMACSA